MTADTENRLYVVVGILRDASGQLFVQQRRPDTPKAGKWEFPGGKLESGESPQQALARELHEELGITVRESEHLTVVTHDYDHARVLLDTYLVTVYNGVPQGREGQAIGWLDPHSEAATTAFDFLPAVLPILDAYHESLKH